MIIKVIGRPTIPNTESLECVDATGRTLFISEKCFPYPPKLNEEFEWVSTLSSFRIEPINLDWSI